MNRLLRWGKFNLVGAMGMVVQLAALALFNRLLAGHYLWATALALELTLLHNFAWHVHYTWRDREEPDTLLRRFLRFHMSNGLVSMVGNLVLMRVLVHGAHLPVLLSNGVAILCCSLLNFFLGDAWVFAQEARSFPRDRQAATIAARSHLAAALLLLVVCATGRAQDSTAAKTLPEAPNNQTAPRSSGDPYSYHAGILCGIGASNSTSASRPSAGCGAGITFLPDLIFLEVGVMAPQANRSSFTGYLSVDGTVPLAKPSSKYLPSAIVGYSRLFETGHALDYGLALSLPRFSKNQDESKSLRIELRDYWTFANPNQHNVMVRLGWMTGLPD